MWEDIRQSCHLNDPAETMRRSPPASGALSASVCARPRSRTSTQAPLKVWRNFSSYRKGDQIRGYFLK